MISVIVAERLGVVALRVGDAAIAVVIAKKIVALAVL